MAKNVTPHQEAVMRGASIHGAAATRDQAGPDLMWELIERDLADAEWSHVKDPREGLLRRKKCSARRHPSGPVPDGSVARASGPARCQLLRKRRRDNSACADAAFQIALGEKLRVRVQNRESRDPNLGSQHPGGGDPLSRPKTALENSRTKPIIDLAMKRRRKRPVYRNHGKNAGGDSLHSSGS